MKDDEILAQVISDSICMSSYKAAKQGADHKRVPDDIHINPTMVGHEFSGVILKVGKKWQKEFKPGQNSAYSPHSIIKGALTHPGYSFRWIGGDATHILIPNEVMEMNCLLPYHGDAFFLASLSEPMSCVVGAFHASYHTSYGSYVHQMGIKQGGMWRFLQVWALWAWRLSIMLIHNDTRPSLMVVTDIDQAGLDRAAKLHTVRGKRH